MLYRVFDGHCDTPVELWLQEKQLRSSDLAVSLDKAAGLGGYAQFFAFCTAWIKTRMPHTEHFSRALDYFLAQLRKNEDRITLCRTAPEAEAAMQAGKCAAFLAIEGAEAVREDEGLLELAYEAGVRMVSLVWNLPNGLSGSCQTGEGLTEKGKRFFRRAQKLGMLVDVSHLSEKGFWDMAELAEKPIVASHSDSFAVCPHPRNLTDAQISAIVHNEGVIGLNLCPAFLGLGRNMDAVLAHIDHFLCMDARENLCIGTDFDGIESLPEGITGVESMEELYEQMLAHRFSEALVQDIFFNNLRRFLGEAL